MLWIGLHLPLLSLESFAATLGPAQAGRPLVLVEAQRIVQADGAALQRGVRPGMKRATALALVPDLLPGQADAVRDAQALQAVAHVALAFTPAVALDAQGAGAVPAGVVGHGVRLEVQASLRCFGGQAALLQRLGAALQPLGHRLRVASAPTALGAALLARWRDDLASGAHSTDIDALRRLLDAAPLRLLGAGREHREALQGMGLRTLGDLRTLPRAGLARRFGPALLSELDRARGEAPEPHDWVELPAVFSSRLELFARADGTEQVGAGARILLARLVAWAQARHGRIARFTLCMHHEPAGRIPARQEGAQRQRCTDEQCRASRAPADAAAPACTSIEIALAEPALDAAHLQLLLAERLARLPLAAPALELSLQCDELVAAAPPNAELFPSHTTERAGLARLIERLQARLGRAQVRSLVLRPDHRPERATQSRPAEPAALRVPVDAARSRVGRGSAATLTPMPCSTPSTPSPWLPSASASTGPPGHASGRPPEHPLSRPIWLLPEPQPLRERAAGPLLDGRPLQLLGGPERIESGWWDSGLAARDYFIALAADGALVWIYRARLPQSADAQSGWFLQGRFA